MIVVKNNQRDGRAQLGPRAPVAPRLSPARTGVLQLLIDADDWLNIGALSTSSGLHGNTVREHLDALIGHGFVQRKRAAVNGRGRPAWLYTADSSSTSGPGEYAALATALAGQLARSSADPMAEAVSAGVQWGREVAGDQHTDGPLDTRRRVVQILDELGFDPDPDADWKNIKLRRCPLIDAARVHPDVVCGVHDGIVKGALESLGADPTQSELNAFHEPGACRLQL